MSAVNGVTRESVNGSVALRGKADKELENLRADLSKKSLEEVLEIAKNDPFIRDKVSQGDALLTCNFQMVDKKAKRAVEIIRALLNKSIEMDLRYQDEKELEQDPSFCDKKLIRMREISKGLSTSKEYGYDRSLASAVYNTLFLDLEFLYYIGTPPYDGNVIGRDIYASIKKRAQEAINKKQKLEDLQEKRNELKSSKEKVFNDLLRQGCECGERKYFYGVLPTWNREQVKFDLAGIHTGLKEIKDSIIQRKCAPFYFFTSEEAKAEGYALGHRDQQIIQKALLLTGYLSEGDFTDELNGEKPEESAKALLQFKNDWGLVCEKQTGNSVSLRTVIGLDQLISLLEPDSPEENSQNALLAELKAAASK